MTKRCLVLFFLMIFTGISLVYAKSYQTGGTGFIGGITLFEEASPFMGMNNPGLISGYHQIDFRPEKLLIDPDFSYSGFTEREEMSVDSLDAAYDPTGYLPRYGFGRVFLPSFYISIGASEDTYDSSKYLMNAFALGFFADSAEVPETMTISGLGDIHIPTVVNTLTFGLLDISPLFDTGTNTMGSQLSNILEVTKNDGVGIINTMNINILGYYHNNFGMSFYFTSELKTGLFSEERNLLVVKDPTLDINVETGMALTIGFGRPKLPILGYARVGATLRFFGTLEGHSKSIDQALVMAQQLTNYYSSMTNYIDNANYKGIFDFTPFGDGKYVKAGAGVALDFGFHKKINRYTTVAGKLSDVVSPTYWLNTKSFSVWKTLPNLSLGLKHEFRLSKKIWFLMNKPTIFFQINDMFYTEQLAFLSKLHVGVNSRFLFDFLELGVGLNQGYPTLGFTFHITPAILAKIPVVKYLFYVAAPVTFFHLKFNFTAYGRELGRYPGEFGFLGYNVGLDLYIGF